MLETTLCQLLLARHLDQPPVEFRPEAFVLRIVDGDGCQFGFVAAVQFAYASDRQNLVFAIAALALGHQRHLAVVVDEADARQPLVRGALRQLQRLEVAQIDAALRQLLVEA